MYNAAVDLLDRNIGEGRADKIAVVDDAGPHTYAEILEQSKRCAALLRGLGLDEEQRVLLLLHDTAHFVALFLGALRAGIVAIPINTLLTTDDYTYLLNDSRARAVIVSDALFKKLEPALDRAPHVRAVVKASELAHKLAQQAPREEVAATCADDVAFWLYSSGSTGKPKGAVHLHSHLLATSRLYAQPIAGFCESDVVFSAAKLFFAYGLGNALTFPLSVGATAVLMAERATPESVLRTLHVHKPTVFCGVPTLFASILAHLHKHTDERTDDIHLRVSTSAGEALPKHVGEAWQARFRSEILDGIGSTEMLHIFLSNRRGAVRYGTTGVPVPGYDVELRDDSGGATPDGEAGMLWVRGPTACAGYFNQRQKSLETFHGPWTRTGDRYVRDSDGTYTYAGRGDDMLKVGGIWVSPFEVESALSAHEKVLECAVVGCADETGLIKPKAFVVLHDPAHASPALVDELKQFVKDALAPYKYPRFIDFVTELPKTATGKIQRFKLR
ncbi:MAG TPA: benzoate-CoA ligase family protein [Myxococcota bacterium]|jgi:benzoate-CoA ligase family protein